MRWWCWAAAALALITSAAAAERDTSPYPQTTSLKGLQVQMIDDAIALGVKHATLNVDLAALVDPVGGAKNIAWEVGERTFSFRRDTVENLDRSVKPLTDAGIVVSLILLNYEARDEAVRKIMRPARSRPVAAQRIVAFNVDDPEGAAWYRATIDFLAARYCAAERPHGRVCGFIVGNEVNSHFAWYDLGDATLAEVVESYERAVRITHDAVRKYSEHARIYLSLDHLWMKSQYPEPLRSVRGRDLLDAFAEKARAGGDYDWHLGFHPYPANLMEPRTWQDPGLRDDADTPRITPRNLEVLMSYLKRPELLYEGKPRRVIFSEQGFHTPENAEGEQWQAAGFCYTWVKLQRMEGIDAFILHRHVDHAHEGGLRLGLWTNQPGSVATPDRKKLLYEIFRTCDTPEWEKTFAPMLPVIGVSSWSEIR